MGQRVVNENPVAPFDHRNLSMTGSTKPFSQAQNGSYKGTSTAIIYTESIQATLRRNVSSLLQCGRVLHPLQYPDVKSMMLIYSKIQLWYMA